VAKKSKFATIWTDLMSRRVEGLFDQGGAMIEVSRLMGINRSTFNRWSKSTDKEKQKFREVVEIGKEAAEAFWIRQGRENLENKSFNTALYSFMMVNKFGYRSAYSKQERDITETKTTKFEVKKAVDVKEIMEKLLEIDIERPEVLN